MAAAYVKHIIAWEDVDGSVHEATIALLIE